MRKKNRLQKFSFVPSEYNTTRELVEKRGERLAMPTTFSNLSQKITIYYATLDVFATFFRYLDKQ